MRAPLRTLRRCLVCGFAEVVTDEVVDRGLVLLAECPRCEHRWTEPGSEAPPARVPLRARAARGIAGAA
jgi:DNA polymerase III alpha subunit (gram-positive type)